MHATKPYEGCDTIPICCKSLRVTWFAMFHSILWIWFRGDLRHNSGNLHPVQLRRKLKVNHHTHTHTRLDTHTLIYTCIQLCVYKYREMHHWFISNTIVDLKAYVWSTRTCSLKCQPSQISQNTSQPKELKHQTHAPILLFTSLYRCAVWHSRATSSHTHHTNLLFLIYA